MIDEIDHLARCRKDIEDRLQIGDGKTWSLRNFEHLSQRIYEKTDILLSVSTLKRLWIYKPDTLPNISTLDALARFLDAKSWFDYLERLRTEPSTEGTALIPTAKRPKPSFLRTYRTYGFVLAAVLLLTLGFLLLRKPSYTFYLRNDQLWGVPNTVEFVYDIRSSGLDYGFVQQDWDPARQVRISANENSLFNTYHFPGYFEASLVVGNKMVRKVPVFIRTKGWVPVVMLERYQVKPTYLPVSSIAPVNLHVRPSDVAEAGVDVNKPYFTNFFNVRDFGDITCDNVTLVSELRCLPAEGGAENQYTEVILKFQDGRILIPFSRKGSTSTLDVEFGERYLDGSENDFSCFGIDLTRWRTIKLLVRNRRVNVFLEDLKVFDVAFEKNMGKLVGIQYCFGGCGSVRKTELFDGEGRRVFVDAFGNP